MSNWIDTLRVVLLDEMEVLRATVDEGHCHCVEVEVEALSTRVLSSAEYILYTTRYSSLTFGVRGEELGGVSGILGCKME